VRSDESIDIRSATIAVVVSLGLHLLLLWALPETFHRQVVALVRPVEVATAPVKIDEARLPPKLRFAETNPAANQAVPKTAPFTSSRNQTAAQPVPEKMPTDSPLPKSAGTSEQIRLAQGKPRSIDQSQAAPSAQPAISMASPPADKPKPGLGKKVVAQPASAPVAANPDRPRASAPSGTYGLLLRRPVGVSRAGSLAIDARFSNYGDYTQRMMEAIQSSWWSIIERSRFEGVSRGHVVVSFRLHRDGTVTDAKVLGSEVTRVMTLACKDAVMAPAPYDIWRADMVAMYGESDTVTINFHYY
jgi:outer membrane biosynthesis protein TonB